MLAASTVTGASADTRVVESFRASPARPHHRGADNGSSASGTAYVFGDDSQITTALYARGLTPELPHAMHIHGFDEVVPECRSLGRDEDSNGLIDTLEGIPDYGGILVSLTTSGGTGGNLLPDGLDLSCFPWLTRAAS